MPINDSTPTLETVLSAMRLPTSWVPDGTPLRVYAGFFTTESFALRASQLGWVAQQDGSYIRISGQGTQTMSSADVLAITVTSAQANAIQAALSDWARFANITVVSDPAQANAQVWIGNRPFDQDSFSQSDRATASGPNPGVGMSQVFFNTSSSQNISLQGDTVSYAQYAGNPSDNPTASYCESTPVQ